MQDYTPLKKGPELMAPEERSQKHAVHYAWVDANREQVNAKAREWYQRNKERRKAAAKIFRDKNAERVLAEATERRHSLTSTQRERYAMKMRNWRSDISNWGRFRANVLKQTAKTRGLPFDPELKTILQEMIQQSRLCRCCGKTLQFGIARGHQNKDSASVDKVVPSLGYVRNNVQIVCTECNRRKSDSTLAQQRQLLAYTEKYNPEQGAYARG